jgi:hypothetical protein
MAKLRSSPRNAASTIGASITMAIVSQIGYAVFVTGFGKYMA